MPSGTKRTCADFASLADANATTAILRPFTFRSRTTFSNSSPKGFSLSTPTMIGALALGKRPGQSTNLVKLYRNAALSWYSLLTGSAGDAWTKAAPRINHPSQRHGVGRQRIIET